MSGNIESTLIEASSKEIVKKAKSILKSGQLICCFRDAKKDLNGCFADSKGGVDRVSVTGYPLGPFLSICTCSKNRNLCCHAVASIIHTHKQRTNTRHLTSKKEAPAKYAGLKHKNLSELAVESITAPSAELHLSSETEFPHVPSKWEKTVLTVTLVYGRREYKGSLANLRQLHFGKSMAASLDISYFSLQDRQIIRFLAINSEPESTSKVALDAEETAEFFHCLSGFNRFLRLGRGVIVHNEPAEPILVSESRNGNFILHPAIVVDGAMLPLHNVKIVTGRSGCWVGISGEYWWIPAFADVAWLRSFLRISEQHCDLQTLKLLQDERSHFPIRVVDGECNRLTKKECKLLYAGSFSAENSFELELSFAYDGVLFGVDGARLACSDGIFWKRDNATEKAAIEELTGFGFERVPSSKTSSVFVAKDIEVAGIFATEIIPAWRDAGRRFFMDNRLTSIATCEDNNIMLNCSLKKRLSSSYEITYSLGSGDALFKWKDVAANITANRHFMLHKSGRLLRITKELARFMDSVSDIVGVVKGDDSTIKLPLLSAPYWADKAATLPDAVPQEFIKIRNSLSEAATIMETKNESKNITTVARQHRFKGSLRDYQRQGATWLKELCSRKFNPILADEMGLGKTIQALALLAEKTISGKPSMVLCPTSLVENWRREAKKFVPSLKVLTIRGQERQTLWQTSKKFNLLITSYSMAKRDHDYFKKTEFNYLILDEAQHIKNPSTGNAKTCKSIKSLHKIVLTGTPLENSPEDLWSIFDFLHPGMLGTFNGFKRCFSDIHNRPERQEDLATRIAPFILRRKKAEVCTELPPKQEQTLFCTMSASQRAIHDEILSAGRKQCQEMLAGNRKKSSFDILTTLLRLRQVCCHPLLIDKDHSQDTADNTITHPSAKTELLQELLLESIDSGHKVLLFSQFTSLLKIIRSWLESESIAYEYLDGSTKNRMERVDNFNNSNIPVFLLSLKAGGTGLNLTSADRVIIYDPWWNPAVEAQATDRTHRIGQTNPVNSIKLVVKDSIEEKILELQKKKKKIFDNLVDAPSSSLKKLTLEDIESLFE